MLRYGSRRASSGCAADSSGMIRFPAVLTAKLARARIARAFQSSEPGRLLEFADAAEVLHAGSEHPVSHDKIRSLLASPAPIVWIGGSEPLTHSGIAHLVRALARSGVYLFLETDGLLLRRRIPEFQPLPRVFLTVRPDAKRKSDCDLAMEGLRASRLSGFFTCVHSQVGESSPPGGPPRPSCHASRLGRRRLADYGAIAGCQRLTQSR